MPTTPSSTLHNLSPSTLTFSHTSVIKSAGRPADDVTRHVCLLVQSHVIKFAREVMNPPAAGLSEDVHARLCRYIDLFTVWDESKRVEQYSMLHFDWSVAKDGKVQVRCLFPSSDG